MRITTLIIGFITLTIAGFIAINSPSFAVEGVLDAQGSDLMNEAPKNYPVATLAGGCFWCIESEFRSKDGVLYTRVGYTGGPLQNPTYKDITTGETGHAEAIEVTFDPKKISYSQLIEYFLTKAHDPKQLNRQGVDVGPQYRSEIFYHDDAQKEIAEQWIADLNQSNALGGKVVTKVSAATKFWLAEDYHQQYYEKYEEKTGQVHQRVFFKKQIKKLKGL